MLVSRRRRWRDFGWRQTRVQVRKGQCGWEGGEQLEGGVGEPRGEGQALLGLAILIIK